MSEELNSDDDDDKRREGFLSTVRSGIFSCSRHINKLTKEARWSVPCCESEAWLDKA